MRIVHFADVHLGYRAYHRLTPEGINQREQDAQDAFHRALKKTVELQPDLVLIAGDLFHTVRPSNLVLQRTFRAFHRFRRDCGAPILLIAGNHESPRSVETGCILRLFENIPGIHVRDQGYDALHFAELDAMVCCLPHRGLAQLSELSIEPSAQSGANLLVLHGTLEDVGPNLHDSVRISRSRILSDRWDYIACGHYHIHTKLADNAYYSGSTEYTSPNPWEEVGKEISPKGLIEYDTDRRHAEFHPIGTRALFDLKPVHGNGLPAERVMEAIEEAVAGVKGGLEGKIVRLLVWDIPRTVQVDLNHARLRELRNRALHLDLSLRVPRRGEAHRSGDPAVRTRRTLEQEWTDHVEEMEMPGGVDREELRRIGLEYLARASDDAPVAESAPSSLLDQVSSSAPRHDMSTGPAAESLPPALHESASPPAVPETVSP